MYECIITYSMYALITHIDDLSSFLPFSNNGRIGILEHIALHSDDFTSIGEMLEGITDRSKNIINFYFNLLDHFPKRGHFTFPTAIYENYFPTHFFLELL